MGSGGMLVCSPQNCFHDRNCYPDLQVPQISSVYMVRPGAHCTIVGYVWTRISALVNRKTPRHSLNSDANSITRFYSHRPSDCLWMSWENNYRRGGRDQSRSQLSCPFKFILSVPEIQCRITPTLIRIQYSPVVIVVSWSTPRYNTFQSHSIS